MASATDLDDAVDAEIPDTVQVWLSSAAAERGMSETALLRSLLSGTHPARGASPDPPADESELRRVEREFRELVEDVRDRILQVKRETNEKAPADHTHPELNDTIEQLDRELDDLATEMETLDQRLDGGFENYEEILTYLTDATDALDRKLGRLASAVIGLRELAADASRDDVERTALSNLTETANRHGVQKAKCEECSEGVNVGMLVEPRCPHCDSTFSELEPKWGFFRKSVLKTGTPPALESGFQGPGEKWVSLERLVQEAGSGDSAPSFVWNEISPETGDQGSSTGAAESVASNGGAVRSATSESNGQSSNGDLRHIDGIGSTQVKHLKAAGIQDVHDLASADPDRVSETIDEPSATVAEWVELAATRTSS